VHACAKKENLVTLSLVTSKMCHVWFLYLLNLINLSAASSLIRPVAMINQQLSKEFVVLTIAVGFLGTPLEGRDGDC